MTTTATASARLIRALQLVAASTAVIGGVKFVAIGAEVGWRWEHAPWGVLIRILRLAEAAGIIDR